MNDKNISTNKIHLWIFNEASAGAFLTKDAPLFKGDLPELIVEVSGGPVLAHYFNLDAPADFPGIAGLLHPGNSPDDFAMKVNGCDFPVLFAAAQPLPGSVLGSALQMLQRHPEMQGQRCDVFVEFSVLDTILPWLHGFDRVGMLLGLSAAPSARWIQDIQTLCTEELIRPDTWAGLNAYFPHGYEPTSDERKLIEESLRVIPNSSIVEPELV